MCYFTSTRTKNDNGKSVGVTVALALPAAVREKSTVMPSGKSREESIPFADQPGAKERIEEAILPVMHKHETVGDKALKSLCCRT